MTSYIGKRYGKISSPMAAVGLKSYAAILEVVDETDNSVALRITDYDDYSLTWILKDDLSKCLEEIGK